jgi:hypothetical protein
MSKRRGAYLVVFVYISLPFRHHIIYLLIMDRARQTNLGYLDFRTFPNNAQAPGAQAPISLCLFTPHFPFAITSLCPRRRAPVILIMNGYWRRMFLLSS